MKLGGLFSGVGGFELAWTRLGGEVAWMCEWDPKARKVLQARFPDVPIYPDVRDLDPAEVEAVDVLTGGSPCQGFSVAGTRSGLEHSESQLFADYVRIMDGLADRGLQFAVWENVPGVLSITNEDGERTFQHVVAALAGATQPVRLGTDKRWNTGMAARGSRAVAWRVLDSRHFGVAQRRRRIFACVAFGDSCEDRAGRSLLAVAEGVPRDFASCGEEGQDVAGDVAASIGVPSVAGTLGASGAGTSRTSGNGNFMDFVIPQLTQTLTTGSDASSFRMTAFGEYDDDDSASTLKQRDYKDATDLVVEPQAFQQNQREEVRIMGDQAGALTANPGVHQQNYLAIPQAFRKSRRVSSVDDFETWVDDGQTLFQPTDEEHTQIEGFDPHNHVSTGDLSATIRWGHGVGVGHARVGYGVRRLTPVECERLQSFPDGWTEPAGSDAARYKAMGNAVTVNVVQWVLGRVASNMV